MQSQKAQYDKLINVERVFMLYSIKCEVYSNYSIKVNVHRQALTEVLEAFILISLTQGTLCLYVGRLKHVHISFIFAISNCNKDH